MNYECLINRERKCPDIEKENLVQTDSKYKSSFDGKSILLEKETYSHWLNLKKEAKKENIQLDITSGYRDAFCQQKILEYYIEKIGFEKAIRRVAIPNYSEHQSGLAIDFTYFCEENNDTKENLSICEDDFEYQWLQKEAHKFGFIFRYPKSKEKITGYSFEPWHLRYVGIPLATKLKKEDLTMEEYYNKTTNIS